MIFGWRFSPLLWIFSCCVFIFGNECLPLIDWELFNLTRMTRWDVQWPSLFCEDLGVSSIHLLKPCIVLYWIKLDSWHGQKETPCLAPQTSLQEPREPNPVDISLNPDWWIRILRIHGLWTNQSQYNCLGGLKHPPFSQTTNKKKGPKKNQRINESLKELWVLIEELGKTCDPIKGSFHVASSAAPRMCSEFLFSASPPGGWTNPFEKYWTSKSIEPPSKKPGKTLLSMSHTGWLRTGSKNNGLWNNPHIIG